MKNECLHESRGDDASQLRHNSAVAQVKGGTLGNVPKNANVVSLTQSVKNTTHFVADLDAVPNLQQPGNAFAALRPISTSGKPLTASTQ